MKRHVLPLVSALSVGLLTLWLVQSEPSQTAPESPIASKSQPATKNLKAATREALSNSGFLENFDKRLQEPASLALTEQQKLALNRLRQEVPEVAVEFEPVKGAPRHIMSPSRFLTQSEIRPRQLSYPEAETKVKDFISQHPLLFGHAGSMLDQATVSRRDTTESTGLQTLIWQQRAADLPVFDSYLKANLSQSGEIMGIGSEWMARAEQAVVNYQRDYPVTAISVEKAIALAAANLGTQVSASQVTSQVSPNSKLKDYQFYQVPGMGATWARQVWLPLSTDEVRLAWEVTATSLASGLYTLVMDAQSGEAVVRVGRGAADAVPQYQVYTNDSPTPMSPGHDSFMDSFGKPQPPETNRQLVQISAQNPTASPNGWINDGVSITRGNNIAAFTDTDGDNVPDPNSSPTGSGTDSRTFQFPLDLTQEPSTYANASVTNAFYRTNWIHDRLYTLGFTETSGNFQLNNFNRNGPAAQDQTDGDPVSVHVQDSYVSNAVPNSPSRNNAQFFTPPDGVAPWMELFVFDGPTPDRDSALNSETLCHEYVHGLTMRLVGGGDISLANPGQPAGMGEGWSDFYALSLLSEAHDNPEGTYAYGAYSYYKFQGANYNANYYFGNRRYPKSTDLNKNPLTYKDMDPNQASLHPSVTRNPTSNTTASQPHAMGEIWSSMLWEIRTSMVQRYGWEVGNEAALQLVTDALKLTTSSPNFVQARNAILMADLNSGGYLKDLIWKGFAKRGLGSSASPASGTSAIGVIEAYDTPPSTDSTAPIIAFSPLVDQQTIFEFTSVGPTALKGTISETGGVFFHIEEDNGLFGTPRYWNGFAWISDRYAPGVLMNAIVSGGTWTPAPHLNLPSAANLRNGNYRVVVRATDNAGNTTTNSITLVRSANAESVPPVASITAPAHNATIAGFHALTGTASDPQPGSGLTGAVTLTIRNNGDYWSGTAWLSTPAQVNVPIQSDGTWNCNLLPAGPNFRTGVFTVRAQAFDWAGNVSAIQSGTNDITFTVDTSLDTTAPVVQISSPAPTGSFKASVNEIYGTVSDTGGSGLFPILSLTIQQGSDYWNGTAWLPSHAANLISIPTSGNWTFTQMPQGANLRTGQYTITALAYDFGGSTSPAQTGTNRMVYTIDSTPPTGTIAAPLNQAHYTNFPGISGTASDASGIENVLVFIRRARDSYFWTGSSWSSQQQALPTSYNPANQTFTSNFTPPNAGVNSTGGTYYYDVIAVDNGGNYSQFGVTVVIDFYATFTWTGLSTANTHLWSDPKNWQCSVPYLQTPGRDDVVIINSGTPSTLPNESIEVRELRLNGGTLTASNLSVNHSLQMNAGQFKGGLTLLTGSSSEWKSGQISGQLNIQTSATLVAPDSGSNTKYLGDYTQTTTVNNAGYFIFDSSHRILGIGGSGIGVTFYNLASATFEIARDAEPLDYTSSTANLMFDNRGSIIKTGGTGTSGLFNYWALANKTGGLVQSQVYTGVLERSSSQTTSFQNGSVLRGLGVIRFASGIVETEAGTWTVEGNGIFDLVGATLRCPLVGSFALAPASASNTLQWRSGTISGNFDILANTLLSLPSGGDNTKRLGEAGRPTTVDNSGTLSFASDYAVQGVGGAGAGVTFYNHTSGVVTIARNGEALDYTNNTTDLHFINYGRVTKNAGSGTTGLFNYWAFTNESGAVIQNNENSGVLARSSAAATLFKNGTILRGSSVISLDSGIITAEPGGWTLENAAWLKIAGATLALPQTGVFSFLPQDISVTHWLAGTIHGNLSIPSGTTIECPAATGQNSKFLGTNSFQATVSNSGTFRFSSLYSIYGVGGTGVGVSFNNMPSGVFDIATNGEALDYTSNTIGLTFTNQGRITKSAGTGNSELFNDFYFNNTSGGIIQNEVANSTLTRNSNQGTLFNSGTIIRGPGTIALDSGTITAYAGSWTIDSNATLLLQGATIAAPNVDRLTLAPQTGSSLVWSSGTLLGNFTIPASATLTIPSSGGNRAIANNSSQSSLQVDGNLRWLGGNPITGHGGSTGATIAIGSTGYLDLEENGSPFSYTNSTSNLVIQNNGRIRKTAGAGSTIINDAWTLNLAGRLIASTGYLDLSGNASFNAGSIIDSTGSGQCRLVSGTVQVNATTQLSGNTFAFMGGTLEGNANGNGILNSGVLEWTGGTVAGTLGFGSAIQVHLNLTNPKAIAASSTLNNAGNIYWINGPIYGSGGSVLNNLTGGTFNVNQSSYSLDYSSPGNSFVNAGTLNIGSPAGTLNISNAWSFTQTTTGVMNIDIGGTANGAFDQVQAPASAFTLGGTLNVNFTGGFVPAMGNSFAILNYASHTGTFASVNSGSILLSKLYNATNFTLAPASEPTNYNEWKDLHFGAGSPNAGDDLDPDHDGIRNLMEYATGSSPTTYSVGPTTINPPASGVMYFEYNRSVTAMSEITYQVEWRDDLSPGAWSSVGVTETILNTLNGIQKVRATVPTGSGPRRFVHLKITK